MGACVEQIKKAQSGDEEAMELLLKENEGLVVHVARRFFNRGCEQEDLFQIGRIGLMKAIRGFDVSRGLCFSTYAVPMIMGEIRRFLRDDGIVKVSRSIRENGHKIACFEEAYEKKWGQEPTILAVAEGTGLSVDDVAMAKGAFAGTVPYPELEERVGEEDVFSRALLTASIDALPVKERQLIGMRYYMDMSQSQVAKVLETSQGSVSRMEKKVLKSLRRSLE